ncbi:hypothetical protein FF38_10702 [Lucilia cuprina]|uniref:DUF243 domain-containing protein n=1 Tax=Lucilia cuprina TaxID=7375 RepID=A0A0L0BXL5_LUCCU|nr:hypothetical protein CVS40_11155 [Lucilia cuprina]KNC24772.1 hypothetical protein FF38_10702 [Lucilia cuprina]
MIFFVIISTLAIPVFSAPQGYEYKKPAPVIERFPSIGSLNVPTCEHATQTIEDMQLSLIQSQSQGRIVNHNTGVNHQLEPAASVYSPQLHNEESLSKQFLPNINLPSNQFFNGYSHNQGNIAANAQINNYTPIAPGRVHAFSTGNEEYKHNGVYANSVGHTSNFAATPSTHHNIQKIPNVGVNAYTDSFTNSAVHQSLSGNSIKLTTNTNLNFNGGVLNGQLGQVIRETFVNAPLDPSIEKHIYVHVPPEDLEEDNKLKLVNQQQVFSPLKKHYKIIFIKAPSYPKPNYSQLAAAVAPQTEEKTLVYVLVKKPELPSLEQVQQSTYKSSKPEVYFIKYKAHKDGDDNDSINKKPIDNHSTENGNELIDIRSGGVSNSVSTSTIYSSSLNKPKHELYGVPLQ